MPGEKLARSLPQGSDAAATAGATPRCRSTLPPAAMVLPARMSCGLSASLREIGVWEVAPKAGGGAPSVDVQGGRSLGALMPASVLQAGAMKPVGGCGGAGVAARCGQGESERALVRRMAFDLKKSPSEIAEATGRHISSICRALQRPATGKARGRPPALTPAKAARVAKVAEQMVRAADAKKEITLRMVMTRARVRASVRTVQTALHRQGVYFRRMRTKPRLTEDDIKARFAFATKYKGKSEARRSRVSVASVAG